MENADMDLTESQKIIVTQLADRAGCDATMSALDVRIGELLAGYHAGRRMVFGIIGDMPPSWIDAAIDRLMSRRPKK